MADSTGVNYGSGYPSLTRRERLERIADAERDRRAGRIDLAIASIGEPIEWPARVVLALARLTSDEEATRRLLEEGLDRWARESGLGLLDASTSDVDHDLGIEEDEVDPLGLESEVEALRPALETPLDSFELDRAFAEAQADVESMMGANDVAERVLMGEPVGFAAMTGDDLTPVDEEDESAGDRQADELGMDAASFVSFDLPSAAPFDPFADTPEPAAFASVPGRHATSYSTKRQVVLATLETWLTNLERHRAGRAG